MSNWKNFTAEFPSNCNVSWDAEDLNSSKNAVRVLFEGGVSTDTILDLMFEGSFGNLDVPGVLREEYPWMEL